MRMYLEKSTKRIEYIDALRGFTMVLVILTHVAMLCMHIKDGTPSIHRYLLQIRMPMFFFISGFVMYKATTKWDIKYIWSFLKKKFPIQIISTAIFFLAFCYVKQHDFWEKFTDSSKDGYWFTYTLFIYYIFYSLIRLFIKNHEDIFFILIAIFFYAGSSTNFGYKALPISEEWKGILCMDYWPLFFFFISGSLVKKHFDYIQKLLDGKYLILLCIIIYFGINILNDTIMPKHSGGLFYLLHLMVTLSGMVILFSLFRNKHAVFTKQTVIGKTLQYIGRRTLDIYLIHYFFLPENLPIFNKIFLDYPMPVIEFTLSIIVASIVIAFCLIISNVLRLSPTIAHFLFGVKGGGKPM